MKCKICETPFIPQRSNQKTCLHPECKEANRRGCKHKRKKRCSICKVIIPIRSIEPVCNSYSCRFWYFRGDKREVNLPVGVGNKQLFEEIKEEK